MDPKGSCWAAVSAAQEYPHPSDDDYHSLFSIVYSIPIYNICSILCINRFDEFFGMNEFS